MTALSFRLKLRGESRACDLPDSFVRQIEAGLIREPVFAPGSLPEDSLPGETAALVQALGERGLLSRATALATLEPASPHYRWRPASVDPSRACRLSRFAYCRRSGELLLLESPLSHGRVLLESPLAAAIFPALTCPCTLPEVATRTPLAPHEAEGLFALLSVAGMLAEDGEDESEPLASWEFHDLLFHARSRMGRHAYPIGATRRLKGRTERPAAVRAIPPGEPVPLYRPDLNRLAETDRSLTSVLEGRRSSRIFGERPLSAAQLGEFLFRTSRIRRMGSFEGETYAYRPYPCAGASYELEVYAAVRACADLETGLYYYDGSGHSLRAVAGYGPAVERLVEHAWNATGRFGAPQVLLILAARFARVAWKYESIAYSLILKDVGVVMQTMHLAAAAMGLAACAVGCGDSDLFSMAAGTDCYTESSVGEFVLGSAAEPA